MDTAKGDPNDSRARSLLYPFPLLTPFPLLLCFPSRIPPEHLAQRHVRIIAEACPIVVAGQESFIADTPEEAWAWVDATHPEDDGANVQYVRTEAGPRIYADHWYRSEDD